MTKVIESYPELDELLKEYKTESVAGQALEILKSKPDNQWICNTYESTDGNRRCALQWIRIDKPEIAQKLDHDVITFTGLCMESINDGDVKRYHQPTPKQRVIALLQDMIKAGY